MNEEITQSLEDFENGKRDNVNDLFPKVYSEFKNIAKGYMRWERADHTLSPTALVHEVYSKLVDNDRVDWKGKTHFLAIGAVSMRRILVDHARTKGRQKRGGDLQKVELNDRLNVPFSTDRPDDILALDDALTKLEKLDPRQAKLIELRFFGGMTMAEAAEAIGVSKRTVEGDWTFAKAWLRKELGAS